MSTLEELLPELAGVFAAQESAMENAVSMLTTQVAQLIQENAHQRHQAAALESTQQQLQDALSTMRKAYDLLEGQQKRDRLDVEGQQKRDRLAMEDAISGVASNVEQLRDKLDGELATAGNKYASVVSQLECVGGGPSESQVVGLLSDHLASVESKLTAHMEHRLLEMSNRSFLQTQQSEEAVRTELEMLEKKVDYLSRVKMEIKDLGKKIDKQDQTLDGMRMGMELLAKTIGTDEVDDSESESSDRDDGRSKSAPYKPLRARVDKAEVLNVMKRISQSSSDIQAKIDKNAAALLAEAAMAALPKSMGEEATECRSFRSAAAATLQHMPTAPNLNAMNPTVSTTSAAIIRSRRATRLHKRNSSLRLREAMDSDRSELRTPMAKETIKELWRHMFMRFVQLKRLQLLNGANPERIFRKQNISVGARVKRLEESATDMEELVDVLERNIQQNSQGVQALTEMLTQTQLDLSARIDQLNDDRVTQGQMFVGLEEKFDLIEIDLRRVRGSNRRESSQSISSTAISALTLQQQDLAFQFTGHVAALTTVERAVKRVCELDLPALATKFETAMHNFRGEQDHKSKELAKDIHKSIDRVRETQAAALAASQKRMNGFFECLYRDIMTLSKAHRVSLEMVRAAKAREYAPSTLASTSEDGAGMKKRTALFDVSLDMLANIFTSFHDDCKAATNARAENGDDGGASDASVLFVLLERTTSFQSELVKLKEQAEKAKHSPVLAFDGDESGASSSNFVARLALVTNAQLQALESLVHSNARGGDSLRDDDSEDSGDTANSDVSFQVRDLVVQLRAVSSLLSLHSELLDPHQRLRVVLSAQDALQKDVRAHDFSIAQLGAIGATVKMMNSRLDSFLEYSFAFAKDEDVKKSIQEILSSSDSVRDNLSFQLEAAHSEAQQRDERLEHELTQLVARVNKKLDKDELLWTQEVIERQLQSVAKSSLGDSDLVDIHRLLRSKLDKSYFNALLLEQRSRAAATGGNSGGGTSGAPGNAPLIGAKCISCNSEVPSTKAMIKSVVKEQVQQEVQKALARQQQQSGATTGSPSSSFNASTHRSMEKFKKELMAAATAQSPQKSHARR